MKDRDFSARVGTVTSDIRRLVSAERYTTGPIPLDIRDLPMFPVAVGVVRFLDDQPFNEVLTQTGLPGLFRERPASLERGLPVPPPGLSPKQTARTYYALRYLKTLEPPPVGDHEEAKDKWHTARNFRAQGNNPAMSGGACRRPRPIHGVQPARCECHGSPRPPRLGQH